MLNTSKQSPPADTPKKKGLSVQTFSKRLLRFDMVLLVLMLVLAFFLGSFSASNTDLFLHLGLGNPFQSDADDSDWVHTLG